jgi:hypothetical protein
MRTLPVEAQLFHVGRHMTRPIVAYRNFANEHKELLKYSNINGEHSILTHTLSSVQPAE